MKQQENAIENRFNILNGLTKKIDALSNSRIKNLDMPQDVKKEIQEIMAGTFNAASKGNVDLVKKYQKRLEAFKERHNVEPDKTESKLKTIWNKLFGKTELI